MYYEQPDFVQKPKEFHVTLFRSFYSAYLINKQGGYAENARWNRRQMNAVYAFGKISSRERRRIQAEMRYHNTVIRAFLHGMMLGAESERKTIPDK